MNTLSSTGLNAEMLLGDKVQSLRTAILWWGPIEATDSQMEAAFERTNGAPEEAGALIGSNDPFEVDEQTVDEQMVFHLSQDTFSDMNAAGAAM